MEEPNSGRPNIVRNTKISVFDKVQRSFHWSATAILLVLLATGLVLYYPLVIEPFTNLLGLKIHGQFQIWVQYHVIAAVFLLGLVLFHIVWDSLKLRETRRMWPDKQDVKDAYIRTKNFLWWDGNWSFPRSGKYDIFMKSYHILLIVCFVVLGVTGLVQYFVAPWWLFPELLHAQIEPWWKPTLIHDLFGFILIALIVAHTYFSLLPVNRPLFKSMISGKMTKVEYETKYDTRRWQAEEDLSPSASSVDEPN